MKRFVVVCPVTKYESQPMSEQDAEVLLEDWEHPFQGGCVSSHYVSEE